MRVDIQLELGFERNVLLNEEHAAESVSLLDDRDLMAALGSDQRRLHASDTAADNHNIPLMHGRRIIFALKLAPCGGIDRAAILSGGNQLAETGVAAQALVDLVRLTHSRFVGQVRIGNNASADFDDVYQSVSKRFFHHRRIAEGTDGRNRGLDMLFDLSSKLHVDAILKEHGRMHDNKRLNDLVIANRAMDDIAVTVKLLCARNAIFDTIADRIDLGCGHSEVDHEILSADLFDPVTDHDRKPASVLRAAAPSVGAVVGKRAHELMKQPAMAAVKKDHFESRKLNALCCLRVKLNGIQDLLLGHFRKKRAVETRARFVAVGLNDRVRRCPYLMPLDI